jgi:hypothetical protein
MKKLIFFLAALSVFCFPVVVMAQTGDPPPNPISLEMFGSMTALAAGIVALTAFIKTTFNTSGIVTDIVSWVLGPILAIIAWYFNLGMFADLLWYMALLYGVLSAFYANKGWDIISVVRGKKDSEYNKIE